MSARQALLDFAQKKVEASAVMRALVEHDDWQVPIHALNRQVVDGLVIYAKEFQLAPHQLNVFTDRAAADLAATQFGGAPMGIYATSIKGVEIFGSLLEVPALAQVKTLQVNPGSSTAEQWFVGNDAFGLCKVWTQAIGLERVIATSAPGYADAMRQYPGWLCILARSDKSLVRVNKPNAGEHAFIFTAPDLAAHFLESLPNGQGTTCDATTVKGEELFKFLMTANLKGFVINGNSPQARMVGIEACGPILGL